MICFCTRPGSFAQTVSCVELGRQQERAAVLQVVEHVVLLDEREVVAGEEIRLGDQVRTADRLLAEAQMRDGDSTRFLRVVDEISLV